MRHTTCDTWKEVNILSKFQVPCSHDFGVKEFWRFGGKWSLADWINELINYKVVCIIAPATPGLLKHYISLKMSQKEIIHGVASNLKYLKIQWKKPLKIFLSFNYSNAVWFKVGGVQLLEISFQRMIKSIISFLCNTDWEHLTIFSQPFWWKWGKFRILLVLL